MDTNDFLTQAMQYVLGIIPGDMAANVIAAIAFVITLCTLILRFWKEPDQTSKIYWLWKIVHIFAELKRPTAPKKE